MNIIINKGRDFLCGFRSTSGEDLRAPFVGEGYVKNIVRSGFGDSLVRELEKSLTIGCSMNFGESWVDLSRSTISKSMLDWSTNVVMVRRNAITVQSGSALNNSDVKLGESWIITSDPLERSWVDVRDNEILVQRDVKDSTKEKDKYIAVLVKLQMLATAVDVIYNGGTVAIQNWDKIVCGISGIIGGGLQMITMNPIGLGVGALRVASSVKIMWDAYDALTPSQVQEIVADSRASVDAIRLLAKSNQKSLDRVQTNLAKANGRTQEIQACLDKILSIEEHGSAEIKELKNKAHESYLLVQKCLLSALLKFEKADEVSSIAQKRFADVISSLEQMQALFASKDGTIEDRMKTLADLTKHIFETAEKAYEQMNLAQDLRKEGDDLLEGIPNLQTKAAEAFGEAFGVARLTMQNIVREAESAKIQAVAAQKDILQAEQVVIAELKPRTRDIEMIAENVLEDLGVVESFISDKSSLLRMGACAIGAIALNTILGPVPAVLLTLATVKYAHSLANGIANWLAKKTAQWSTNVNFSDNISYEFDYTSTSLMQRCRGKISQTKGSLNVKIGISALSMRFNLKKVPTSLHATELNKFSSMILEAVKHEEITKTQALKLIDDLKTCAIERKTKNWLGRDKYVTKTGFIAKNEPLLNELERKLGKPVLESVKIVPEIDSLDEYAGVVFWC